MCEYNTCTMYMYVSVRKGGRECGHDHEYQKERGREGQE